jgi:hypothetical protein
LIKGGNLSIDEALAPQKRLMLQVRPENNKARKSEDLRAFRTAEINGRQLKTDKNGWNTILVGADGLEPPTSSL